MGNPAAGLLPSLDPTQLAWATQAQQPPQDPGVGQQIAPQGQAGVPTLADPYAGIAGLLATPDDQLRQYAKGHAVSSALQLIGATLSDMGQGAIGKEGTAIDAARSNLYAHAAQPLQLAQAQQQIGAMRALYAQLPPDQRALFIQDPKAFTDQYIKNLQLTLLAQGETLANASAPGGLAPPIPSVTPYSQGANGVLNTANGAFNGVSQPVTVPAGSTAVPFTPSLNGSFGGVAPPPVPASAAGAAAAPGPSAQGGAPVSANYVSRVTGGESNGVATAQNPRSTAGGLGQFVDGTWLGMLAAHRPDLTGGASMVAQINANPTLKTQLLGMKTNPALSQQMTAAYASDNAPQLQSAGLPVNDTTLAIAHGLGGPGAIKLLKADPSTPMSQLVSPLAMKENPGFKVWRASDYINNMQKRMGVLASAPSQAGSTTTAMEPGPAPANATPPAASGPGFGAPIVQGKTAQDIPPQEAMAQGLAPGRWQIKPDGTKVQISKPPDGDMDRLKGLTQTVDALQALHNNQQQFLALNAQHPTGLQYSDLSVHHHDLNPITAYGMAYDTPLKSMHALSQAQTLLVKGQTPGFGPLRLGEIPLLKEQTMDIETGYDANRGIAANTDNALAYATAKQQALNAWLYKNGSANGFDPWFNQWAKERGIGGGGGASAPPSAKSAPAAQSDPLGIR